MNVQLAALCDSAADYGGKLSLLGAFDTLGAKEFPVMHPHCALVVRIVFEQPDAGSRTLMIRCLDPEGKDCLPQIQPAMDITFPSAFVPFVSRNLVINLQNLRFERPGVYRWLVEDGGVIVASVPLRVTHLHEPRSTIGPAG